MATSSVADGVGNTTLGFTDEDRRLLIDVKAQTDKIPAIQAQVNKLTAIQSQTDKLTAIKAKTDTITAGGLTPAQATQINDIQSNVVRIDRGVGIRDGHSSVYFVINTLHALVMNADTNVGLIKAQTDTLPAIKAKTDTITAGGLTPAQATQITGIKSQTDKLSEIQSNVVRINRGVGIRAGDRSVYFVVDAVDTLVRHVDTAVVPIKAQTDTLPAIKVQTDKLSTVDTKVNEIHQRKALDGAKPVTFKSDGAITSSGMNITAQELGDGSIKQTRQP